VKGLSLRDAVLEVNHWCHELDKKNRRRNQRIVRYGASGRKMKVIHKLYYKALYCLKSKILYFLTPYYYCIIPINYYFCEIFEVKIRKNECY